MRRRRFIPRWGSDSEIYDSRVVVARRLKPALSRAQVRALAMQECWVRSRWSQRHEAREAYAGVVQPRGVRVKNIPERNHMFIGATRWENHVRYQKILSRVIVLRHNRERYAACAAAARACANPRCASQ